MADWKIYAAPPPDPKTVQRTATEIKSEPIALSNGAYRQEHSGIVSFKSRNNSRWYDLHNAFLEVRFVLARGDGTALVPGTGAGVAPGPVPIAAIPADVVTLGANAGWALWQKAELVLGNGDPIDSVDWPGFIHHEYALGRYSADQLESAAENEWVYVEKSRETFGGDSVGIADAAAGAGGFNAALGDYKKILGAATLVNPASHEVIDANRTRFRRYNKTFERKYLRTNNYSLTDNKEVTLYLPLRSVFGYVDALKIPIRGIPIELRLTQNTNWTELVHAAGGGAPASPNPGYRVVVRTASLWIPEVTPSAELDAKLNTAMYSNAAVRYKFENRTAFVSDSYTTAASRNVQWRINTLSARPSVVYVMFQHSRQFNNYDDAEAWGAGIINTSAIVSSQYGIANPGIYSSAGNITRLELRVNSKKYPVEDYQLDFSYTDTNAGRAYHDFLEIFYKDQGEYSNIIDLSTWTLSPIFCFRIDADEELFNKVKTVDLTLNATIVGDGVAADGTHVGSFRILAAVHSDRDLSLRFVDGRAIMST
jgi:hypothetical protein